MSETPLRDILIRARQESARMQHYHLGVEHLCIGMLHVPDGALATGLEAQGLTPAYLTDLIRRKVGKGARQRLWAGMPHSPRADVVIGIANDRALESGRAEPDERDLALAMLDEADSTPMRVLEALHVDIARLRASLEETALLSTREPLTEIEFSGAWDADLTRPQLLLLRRMFGRSGRVRLERRLPGGHTSALVLLATPLRPEGEADAAVVVKIDHADAILDETYRYDAFVRHTLPPLSARLIDAPVVLAEENLAGLMYTFLPGETGRTAAADLDSAALGNWLRDDLYAAFGPAWWEQRRGYRFPAWAEYDWLLPPLLTIEHVAEDEARVAFVIRDPVRRARIRALDYESIVSVEDFVVEKSRVGDQSIVLVGGKGQEAARRAFRIEVRKVDLEQNVYFRGETVERCVGRVWRTRDESLMFTVLALDPDFDPRARTIPGLTRDHRLPNPLLAYDELLDRKVDGTLSTLHGDLHLGNILIGLKQAPFLIDFEGARSGHTLFDWASLEVSLLSTLVAPAFGEGWSEARRALGLLTNFMPPLTADLGDEVLYPVLAVRDIVAGLLAAPGDWTEYAVSLAFTALRAVGFAELPLGARRLLYLVSAQAMANAGAGGVLSAGASPDATQLDITNTTP
jgi:hypothetical protein